MIVAQEKVKAVKAEIRAIQKLDLAKDVYNQKMEEQRRLQEVVLLAYQRMGEITREMPKDSSFHGNQHSEVNSRLREDTKPKKQAVQELGFSTSQVGRMEQMAAHPDIVEEVIAESQAGQIEATQGEVLRRIKEQQSRVIDLTDARKERFDRDMAQIDEDYAVIKEFHTAIHSPLKLPVSNTEIVSSIMRTANRSPDLLAADLDDLEKAITKLQGIQILLRKEAHRYSKIHDHQQRSQGRD